MLNDNWPPAPGDIPKDTQGRSTRVKQISSNQGVYQKSNIHLASHIQLEAPLKGQDRCSRAEPKM